jgi:dephospho-CoA kinase
VLLVGLTGGIGSGKSTVAAMLERRGAAIIDADELARRAVDPGTAGYEMLVEAFGQDVITARGEVDRERLAQIVFADPDARRRLESIVHPEVARLFSDAAAAYRDTDRIVVYVVPLLVERSLEAVFDVVVTISASPEIRAARLSASRGMSTEEARGRMSAQLSDEERASVAHVVIDNEGTLEQLEHAVDVLWKDLRERARAGMGG